MAVASCSSRRKDWKELDTREQLKSYLRKFDKVVLFTGHGSHGQYAREDIPRVQVWLNKFSEEFLGLSWLAVYGGDPSNPEKPDIGYILHEFAHYNKVKVLAIQCKHARNTQPWWDRVYYYDTTYSEHADLSIISAEVIYPYPGLPSHNVLREVEDFIVDHRVCFPFSAEALPEHYVQPLQSDRGSVVLPQLKVVWKMNGELADRVVNPNKMLEINPKIFWGGYSKDGRNKLLGASSIWFGDSFWDDVRQRSFVYGLVAVGGGPIAVEECELAVKNHIPLFYIPAKAKNHLNGLFGSIHDWWGKHVGDADDFAYTYKWLTLTESSTAAPSSDWSQGSGRNNQVNLELLDFRFFFHNEKQCADISILLIGAKINGKYTIQKHHGVGAWGNVFSAVDDHGQKVCVKVLVSSHFFENPNFPKREKEINAQQLLLQESEQFKSEHILIPFEVLPDASIVLADDHKHMSMRPDAGRCPVVVLPFLEGGDFWHYLYNQPGKLDERIVCYYFRQCVHAVEALHRAEYCHRDLKLENIALMGSKATLKIIDFGHLKKCLHKSDFCAPMESFECPLLNQPKRSEDHCYNADNVNRVDMFGLGVMLAGMSLGLSKGNYLVKIVRDSGDDRDAEPLAVLDSPEFVAMSAGLKALLRKLLHNHSDRLIGIEEVATDPWVNQDLGDNIVELATRELENRYTGKSPLDETFTLAPVAEVSDACLEAIRDKLTSKLEVLAEQTDEGYVFSIAPSLLSGTQVEFRGAPKTAPIGFYLVYPVHLSVIADLLSSVVDSTAIAQAYSVRVDLLPDRIKIIRQEENRKANLEGAYLTLTNQLSTFCIDGKKVEFQFETILEISRYTFVYPLHPPGLESMVKNVIDKERMKDNYRVRVEFCPGEIKIWPHEDHRSAANLQAASEAAELALKAACTNRLSVLITARQPKEEHEHRNKRMRIASEDKEMVFNLSIRIGTALRPAIDMEWPPNGFCTAAQWTAFSTAVKNAFVEDSSLKPLAISS